MKALAPAFHPFIDPTTKIFSLSHSWFLVKKVLWKNNFPIPKNNTLIKGEQEKLTEFSHKYNLLLSPSKENTHLPDPHGHKLSFIGFIDSMKSIPIISTVLSLKIFILYMINDYYKSKALQGFVNWLILTVIFILFFVGL